MLFCCNTHFMGYFSYVVFSSEFNYRRVEFGICPNCGAYKFRDYRQSFDGCEKVKDLSGKDAKTKLKLWENRLKSVKQGTLSKQNVYFGSFKSTKKKDANGNIIYYQTRKNLNNQSEVIGVVETKYITS